MANLSLRNMARIRQQYPDIAEALADLMASHNSVAQQVNASPVGATPSPAPHAAISVRGGAGILDVALSDNSPQYAGKEHFFDYSQDGFKTFHTKSLGPAKNWRGSLGTGSFQVRSYTQYPTSQPSSMLYHPPVSTTGDSQPEMQSGQGSGTGTAGYGQTPYNADTPPKRL
jgi:hypothetical protein